MPSKRNFIKIFKKAELFLFGYFLWILFTQKQTKETEKIDDFDQPIYLRDIETIQYDLSNYIFRQPKYWEDLKSKDPKMYNVVN